MDSAETILFGGMPMGAYEADRDVEGERRTAVKALMIRPREKPAMASVSNYSVSGPVANLIFS